MIRRKNGVRNEKNNAEIESCAEVSVKKNTFFNLIKTFSTIFFPLITFPYISRVLGAESIGKINFGLSIVAYFSLVAMLGITAYAVRECSKVKNNKEKLGWIVSQIISINLCTALVAYITLAICLLAIPNLENYRLLIMIQSLSIILGVVGADWLNTVMEDFRYITIRTFAFQIISLVCMFIFIRQPEHYLLWAVISLISSSGANLVNIYYRRRYCKVDLTLHIEWKKHLPPVMVMFVMILSQVIMNNLDITMLGVIKGDTSVGLYSTAVKVTNIIQQVTVSITWVVMPQISYHFVRRNYEGINKLLRYASSFTVVLGIPSLVMINIYAEEVIYTIAGFEYLPAANCLRILSISMFWGYINNIYGNLILLPSNKEKRFMIACVLSAVVNAITNAIFIPIWGIYGASMTTAFAMFMETILIMVGTDEKINLGNRWTLIRGSLLGTVVIAIIGIFMKCYVDDLVYRLFIAIFISAGVYFTIVTVVNDEFARDNIKPTFNKICRKLMKGV